MESAQEFLVNGLRRLANLSAGNRMVYMPGIPQRRGIDLASCNHLNGKEAAELLLRILQRRNVALCPVADPRVPSSNEISQRLRRIAHTVEEIREETGRMDLQVGWPVVEGTLNNGMPVRCPLLLIPVELSPRKDRWMLIPRKDVPISFNRAFLQAYEHYHQVSVLSYALEEELDEIGWAENGTFDLLVFLNSLYALLEGSALRINFNRENFSGRIHPLDFLARDEFRQLYEPGKLKLAPSALLGIFPQSESFLEPDFRDMIAMAEEGRPELTSSDTFFESLISDEASDRTIGESSLTTVFPADPWQEDVLRAAARGQSLVVEGPPGTGKSQLICNLVAGAMATGRNVLVVCQKRVALDVVASRLKESGLDAFTALVHDVRDDRTGVYQKIAGHIQSVENYAAEVRQADAILASRAFLQASDRIDRTTDKLEQLRLALGDTEQAGMSAKELYLQTDRHASVISIRPHLAEFPMDRLEDFCTHLRAVRTLRTEVEADEGFALWQNRVDMAGMGLSDLHQMKEILGNLPSEISRIGKPVFEQTGFQPDYFQLKILAERGQDIQTAIDHFEPVQMPYLRMMADAATGNNRHDPGDLWLANLQRLVDACFNDEGVEHSLTLDQLGLAQQALHRALSARRNFFRWIGWEIFSKDRFLIKRTLVANGLSGRQGLKTLERRLDNRLNLEHHLSKLHEFDWSVPLPRLVSRADYAEWFTLTRAAFHTHRRLADIRGLETFLAADSQGYEEVRQRLLRIQKAASECAASREFWMQCFTDAQLDAAGADPVSAGRMMHFIDRHFDRLCALDRRLQSMLPHEREVLDRLEEAMPGGSVDVLVQLFLNSVRMSWIDHLEQRTPELRMVSSGEAEVLQQELRKDLVVKRRLAVRMARMRVLERMCQELEFNRLNNRVTYRDLLHQTTKKRRIWPLRKTMAAHTGEIFRLLPCWLVSPESVSALFPLERHFDLVIFDEASQCFAERGLPAIFRARQVIVAGDDKQLRPSDFYHVRWDDDSEDPDLEADSLLALARRHFPVFALRGHYRSKWPELMEFPNRHFYQDKLRVLPDRRALRSGIRPFEYVRVDGVWKDQTNEAEAVYVAGRVMDLLRQSPEKQIGVITFNHSQQELIRDRLEAALAGEQVPWPPSLMVKNIENVQGDEKDIIFFSIAYAPDAAGKMRMQFGSLSVSGGDNRLNVAITRAREKMVVVTSILPEQLNTGGARNAGPQLLKQWLEHVRHLSEAGVSAQYADVKPSGLLGRAESWIRTSGVPVLAEHQHILLVQLTPDDDLALITDDQDYLHLQAPKYYHAQLGEQLENLGWAWKMVFSRNFWLDHETFREELLRIPRRETDS